MQAHRILIATVLIAALTPAIAPAKGPHRGNAGSSCSQALLDRLEELPVAPLSADEKAALVHLREEEKLARDVYTTLAETWEIPVFANIVRAEQRHLNLMGRLLERHEIADPVTDDPPGVFSDPKMTELFQSLVDDGKTSLEKALRVGATIEDLDLADLASLIEESDKPDIKLVGNNLAKGSRNHLRAFARALEKKGFDPYVAQHLSQERIDEIISSDRERRVVYDENGTAMASGGSGQGKGRGCGHGGQHRGGHGKGEGGGHRHGKCAGAQGD